jgi:hypothetical protein
MTENKVFDAHFGIVRLLPILAVFYEGSFAFPFDLFSVRQLI